MPPRKAPPKQSELLEKEAKEIAGEGSGSLSNPFGFEAGEG